MDWRNEEEQFRSAAAPPNLARSCHPLEDMALPERFGAQKGSAAAAALAGVVTSGLQHQSFNSMASGESFVDASTVAHVVPVAAAPQKSETLYDSLLRYHNENDSSDEDSDAARRNRRRKQEYKSSENSPTGADNRKLPPGASMDHHNHHHHIDNERKPSARLVTQLKSPPQGPPQGAAAYGTTMNTAMNTTTMKRPPPAPAKAKKPSPSTRNAVSQPHAHSISPGYSSVAEPKSPAPTNKPHLGSFYKSALEAQGNSLDKSLVKIKSPDPVKKPGIIHVSEPAIRPDSAMYRAAYGGGGGGGGGGEPPKPSESAFPEPMGVHDLRNELALLKVSKASSRRLVVGSEYEAMEETEEILQSKSGSPSRRLGRSNSGTSSRSHSGNFRSNSGPGQLSQSTHTHRIRNLLGDVFRAPPARNRSNGSLQCSSAGKGTSPIAPPAHMMQIGNAECMGFGATATATAGKSSGKRSKKKGQSVQQMEAANPPPQDLSHPFDSRYSTSQPARHRSAPKPFSNRAASYNPNMAAGYNARKSAPLPPHRHPPPQQEPRRGTTNTSERPYGKVTAMDHPNGRAANQSLNSQSTHGVMADGYYQRNSISSAPPYTGISPHSRVSDLGVPAVSRTSEQSHGSYNSPAFSHQDPKGPDRSISNRAPPPPNSSLQRIISSGNSSQNTANSSIDDDLRLALERSKQDMGHSSEPTKFNPRSPIATNRSSGPPESSTPPTGVHHQTSFGRDAMSRGESSCLSDFLLALKLSEEESGMGGGVSGGADRHKRQTSTNLDELLAFEMTQQSNKHMTDFVAAGISTTTNKSGNNPMEQQQILEKIREDQEQKELELALMASEADAKAQSPSAATGMQLSKDFLLSQQKAMEAWSKPAATSASVPAASGRPKTLRQNSVSSMDSEGRRRELLHRGTSETQNAIHSGQAHIVTCRGCKGRLQAPLSYSLVFCPKCQTISPA